MKVALTQTVTEGFPKGKLFSRNMAKCSNHYELAFESYLRDRRVAYVAVDEQRRSLVAQGSLNNLDFIVTPSDSVSLLVDIKGRRFPSGTRHKQYWRNWSTRDDLASMARWQDKMGPASCALFVFAYEIVGPRSPVAIAQLYSFRDRWYAFLAVRVADYIQFFGRFHSGGKPWPCRLGSFAKPPFLSTKSSIPWTRGLGSHPQNVPWHRLAV